MDIISYIIGYDAGESKAQGTVVIDGGITCADDGEGNITITEE